MKNKKRINLLGINIKINSRLNNMEYDYVEKRSENGS